MNEFIKNQIESLIVSISILPPNWDQIYLSYSGSGDSGDFDDFAVYDDKGMQIELKEPKHPKDLKDRIFAVFENILDHTHGGWYDGNGASGSFMLNKKDMKIVHEHTEVIEEYDTSRYHYEVK